MAENQKRRLEALDGLLARCSRTPAGELTRATTASSLANAKGRLPQRLGQFLDEVIAQPEHSAEAGVVMAAAMQDFGARVFRRFLIAGLHRRKGDTDLAQNMEDLVGIEYLLGELAAECDNTPFLPRDTTELLARAGNGLRDVRNRRRPKLFDYPATTKWGSPRAGAECEGRLAAALEIVIRGGMGVAEAKDWLEAEMRKAGLVDEAGNEISGERVDRSFRNNFNKGMGDPGARGWYDDEIDARKRLLATPDPDRKRVDCQDYARRLVGMLAKNFNRTVPAARKT
jgi:hypothetical protein